MYICTLQTPLKKFSNKSIQFSARLEIVYLNGKDYPKMGYIFHDRPLKTFQEKSATLPENFSIRKLLAH